MFSWLPLFNFRMKLFLWYKMTSVLSDTGDAIHLMLENPVLKANGAGLRKVPVYFTSLLLLPSLNSNPQKMKS